MIAAADSSPRTTAQELAQVMHADAVNLWNRLWREAGEPTGSFPGQEDVEIVQRALTRLAWPNAVGHAR